MTLEQIKADVTATEIGKTGKKYTTRLKEAIIKHHYKSGKSLVVIAKDIGVHHTSLYGWKKQYGKEKTVFVFGDGVRNDIRTKALAVQEYKETDATQADLAKKYGVAGPTINGWIKQYGEDYKDLLDTRDGVPYLVKPEKMIFGNENIKRVLEMKEKHIEELDEFVKMMHENGFTNVKGIEKQAKEKKAKVKKDIDVLKKADKLLAE